MKYTIEKNLIKIEGKDDFVAEHILECGQVFSYSKIGDKHFLVFSKDQKAEVFETESGFEIKTDNPQYFENYFDLAVDYSKIKQRLAKHEILKQPIKFGCGIRILKQDLFETLISFIVSANNNIKRIQMILNRIREKFGSKIGDFYAFPTREQLLKATVDDFAALGAGYRAKYLFNVVRQVDENMLQEWRKLPTTTLRNKLIGLSGVGPKVADCILLFGFSKGDVFPVDTWIEKMYNKFYKGAKENLTREQIRFRLTNIFENDSGYAQQYLFFFMRSFDEKEINE